MADNCGNCGCGSKKGNCGTHDHQLDQKEIEKKLAEKKKHQRKYTVEYRIKLQNLECNAEELIERVKAYAGIVDEVEFTEKELIISYDDRLITQQEISDLVH